ncbi:MAG: sterol desaturase family protein [Saprospiraceae bacterium]|jgi:lathosterol oxidase|nr:sterol desaturase family protein [Saprospiraceae bacterium]
MEGSFMEFWLREAFGVVKDYFLFAGGAFILFYFILKKPMWFRKVQKKMPKNKDYFRDIMYSLVSVTIFATVALVVFYFYMPQTNIYFNFNDHSLGYYIITWVWMFFLHDSYFYWMHRGMHHPILYKYVHLVHHKSTNPSPWTAYAFHPIEGFLEAMIVPLIAFTVPVHISSIGLFFLFQIFYNVYGHLGFELYPRGFHKTWIGKYINTSVAHNLHHKRFDGNYGLYFLIWDRLMGTVREDYDSTFDKATTRE